MKTDTKIAVVGGDARQIFCAGNLAALGYETAVFGFDGYNQTVGECTRCDNAEDALFGAKAVILPLPSSSDGITLNMPLSSKTLTLAELFSLIDKKQLLLYGKYSSRIEELAKKHGIKAVDYYEREEFKIANAVPTAESALAIAINEVPVTISNTSCLVMGYGRIGRTLCRMLHSLGAKVYASARKCADFAWIENEGCTPVHTDNIGSIIGECMIIYNTIPKTILGDELLGKVNKQALIIDLASKPGGVDFELAKSAGLNVIWALSLPGKTSPVTAGEILSDTITNILSETEEEL